MRNVDCIVCGSVFQTKAWNAKFCSVRCKDAHEDRKHEHTCENCGKVFYKRVQKRPGGGWVNAGRYCSKRCKDYAQMNGHKHAKVFPFQCEICDKIVIGRNGPQRVCSTECRMEYARRCAKDNKWRPDRVERCVECGKEFVISYPDKRRTFCGAACSGRDMRRRRKTRIRSKRKTNLNVIHLSDLWDRDNGRCIHCGQVVIRNGHGKIPHPFGHSIDHIRPLAFHGAHTLENTGLTHFCCNTKKAESLREYDRSFYRSHLNNVLFSIIRGENEYFSYVVENKGEGVASISPSH